MADSVICSALSHVVVGINDILTLSLRWKRGVSTNGSNFSCIRVWKVKLTSFRLCSATSRCTSKWLIKITFLPPQSNARTSTKKQIKPRKMRKIKPEFLIHIIITTQIYILPYLILKNDKHNRFQSPCNPTREELIEDGCLDDVHHVKYF